MIKKLPLKLSPPCKNRTPHQETDRPKYWFLYILSAVIPLLFSSCAVGNREAPTPTPLPLVVEEEKILFPVERGHILAQREITGEVVPAIQEQLFFRARGYVTRIAVNAGDLVEEGQVLAELQLDDLLDQLEQAQIDLEVAQDNYANDQLQREYDIKKSRAEVSIWENQVELASKQLQQATGLERENAQLNLENAQTQLELARAWLELVENKSSVFLEQDVRRKELSLERIERLVAERQIIAPFDGIVLKNNLFEGSEIDAFAPAILLGDPVTLVIRTPIDSELSRILTEDTRVYLVGKNLGRDSNSAASSTENDSDTSQEEPVEQLYPIQYIPELLPVSEKKEGITVIGDDISLNFHYFRIPKDTATGRNSNSAITIPPEQLPILKAVLVRVIIGEKEDALLLNPAGIRGIDEFKYVIVLDDDLHRRVEIVRIGLRTTDKWEISGELQPGDQVLGP